MTDSKLTDMTAITSPVSTDVIYIVHDPGGTPVDRKVTLSDMLKGVIASAAQGDVIYFDGTNWVRLAAGTSGQFLKTQGASANPAWATVSSGATDTSSSLRITSGDDGTGSVGFGWREPFTNASDITVAAATGDLIEVSASGQWATAGSFDFLDVVLVNSYQHIGDGTTAVVTSTTGSGAPGWASPGSGSVIGVISGSLFYTVQSGDISGGNIVGRIITRTTSGGTLRANSTQPFLFSIINHHH